MKTVRLYGDLADKFGSEFKLAVKSAREAAHGIGTQIPAFKKYLLEAEQKGVGFAVFLDDLNIVEDQVEMQTTAEEIHIMPKPMGSDGVFGIITGALLIGAGFMFGMPFLVSAGIGLMAGGVVSLLMPVPDIPDTDMPENKPNYGFGGAVTTVAQGHPVPILYGRRVVGGFMASGGTYAEETSSLGGSYHHGVQLSPGASEYFSNLITE